MFLDHTSPYKCCFTSQFHFTAKPFKELSIISLLFPNLIFPLKLTPVWHYLCNFSKVINLLVSSYYFSVSFTTPISYLENSMDRGARQATVHGVAKSWTQLKELSAHACVILLCFYLHLPTQSIVKIAAIIIFLRDNADHVTLAQPLSSVLLHTPPQPLNFREKIHFEYLAWGIIG